MSPAIDFNIICPARGRYEFEIPAVECSGVL